jgi:hypothetical protein
LDFFGLDKASLIAPIHSVDVDNHLGDSYSIVSNGVVNNSKYDSITLSKLSKEDLKNSLEKISINVKA